MERSLIMSIFFEKLGEKCVKYACFLQLTLRQLKKYFQDTFSAFGIEDNMRIEYI